MKVPLSRPLLTSPHPIPFGRDTVLAGRTVKAGGQLVLGPEKYIGSSELEVDPHTCLASAW